MCERRDLNVRCVHDTRRSRQNTSTGPFGLIFWLNLDGDLMRNATDIKGSVTYRDTRAVLNP